MISTAANVQWYPSVAYDSGNGRFLVTWEDERNSATTGWDIYGQLVNANGLLNGPSFAISTAANDQYASSVAYNSHSGNFLIAFETWDVYDIAFTVLTCPDPVMNYDTSVYYTSLQEAYNEAGNGHTILSQAQEFTENLDIDDLSEKSVNIVGGYDCTYSAFTGNTILNGDMTISNGTVTIDDGTFEVQ
jgi:hypothetical protein